MDAPRYDDLASTAAYRALLAERFGIAFATTPEEQHRPLRRHVVHVDRHVPGVAPRGTVLLVHGAGGHGRLLAPFALPCLQAGWEVLAPDLPGYGLTRLAPGALPDYADWIEILTDLADEASRRGPVVTFGMSVGGLTALRVAQKAARVDGVIATTLLDLGDPRMLPALARHGWLGALARAGFRALPALLDPIALPLSFITPLETLTTDPALRSALLTDPLLGRRRVPMRFFRSIHEARMPDGPIPLACPLRVLHPGADAWTPAAMSRPLFDRVVSPDKRFVTLTNGAHAPLETPAFAELRREIEIFLSEVGQPRARPPG